ncbi:MAG: hypothetical protein QOD36_936 [Mycobacterium sp.]|jgi:hypothetical protein|nr:hypothetical protein [Mycobacterium sp.]
MSHDEAGCAAENGWEFAADPDPEWSCAAAVIVGASVPVADEVTRGAGGRDGAAVGHRARGPRRAKIDGLPEEFSFHDLRHYLASLLTRRAQT